MRSDDERIRRLLESVSDGERIDWTREEGETRGGTERNRLRTVRIVSEIADYHARAGGAGLVPGDACGWFEIVAPLGQGSYGDVYLARDTRLDREVALKILRDAEAREADRAPDIPLYLEEARRLARLRHPNVVTIHSVESLTLPSGRPAPTLVMEYVRGESLAEIVSRQGPMSAAEIAAIGIEVCRALSAVHAAGLVHQDLKPQNVRRERGGRIVLMDFGPGGATPPAMAPELFGSQAGTVRSDVYGVGVVLFHLATGSYPVLGRDVSEIRNAHREGKRSSVRASRQDLPASLTRVIERALAPDPSARFASAAELEAALAPCAADSAVHAAPASPRPWPLRRARVLAGAGALAAIVFLALWIGRGTRQHVPAIPGDRTLPAAQPGGAVTSDAAAGAYTIGASFYRGGSQRERLMSGAAIAPGDSVSMRIKTSEPVFLYVIDEDDRGEAYLLFPSRAFTPTNPLAAGIDQRIPCASDGRDAFWRVTSAGGHEHLLVVASLRPLEVFDQDLAEMSTPERDAEVTYTRVTSRAAEALRGMGGYVVDEKERRARDSRERLFDLAGVLSAREETARGVWIRKIDLRSRPR